MSFKEELKKILDGVKRGDKINCRLCGKEFIVERVALRYCEDCRYNEYERSKVMKPEPTKIDLIVDLALKEAEECVGEDEQGPKEGEFYIDGDVIDLRHRNELREQIKTNLREAFGK